MYYFMQIHNEKQALKLISKQLGRIYCPGCHRLRYVRRLKGSNDRYFCQKCRYKFSLKVVLGFKHSNLSYLQLIRAIACFSQKQPLKTVMNITGMSYPTVRYVYSRLRRLLPKFKDKIMGDIIVDECFVGKQKTDNQVIVAGAVNREFTCVKLKVIPDLEQGTVESFLCQNVKVPSLITTDGWSSYGDIEWYGYGHQIDNHSQGQLKLSVPIERVWALFKTLIRRTYHHIWKETIEEYLMKFQARFNYREIVNNPFNLLAYLLKPCSKLLI